MEEKNTNPKGDTVNTNKIFGLPLKFSESLIENFKKNSDLSLGFVQGLEKNQREFFKATYEILNISLPFEENFWNFNGKVVEHGIKMVDDLYEKIMKVWK